MDYPEVIFEEDSHTYKQGGVVVPRSATGLLKKYGLGMNYGSVPRHVLELARQRGVAIAAGRTLIIQGYELDPETIDPRIAGYLESFNKFWHTIKPELIETEVAHVSPLGYGFKADMFCFVNGVRTVIDDKATFKVPKSVGPQTGAYKIGWNSLYPDQPMTQRASLWLKKDGAMPKFTILEDPDDETAFMDCLDADIKLERWKTKYGE